MISKSIYLDNNATTPVDPRVLDEMLPYFSEKFGNASSTHHHYGWDAEEAVTIAREQTAQLIHAKPKQIYFTSGATEAINLALKGMWEANKKDKNHIITSQTEHRAVLDTCSSLEEKGAQVTYLGVDKYGSIDLGELAQAITERTLLVCIMHANNEIGTLQPIKEISTIVQGKGSFFMTDATQSVGKIPFDVAEHSIDLAVFSSHKMYGPKGAGALFIRKQSGLAIHPFLHGGGHEKGMRPGTLNVPAIAGFGKACELCLSEIENEGTRLRKLRDRLESTILEIEDVFVNGHPTLRLPHVTNLAFDHIEGSHLIRAMKGLAISQGSACSTNVVTSSHVLKSLGVSDGLASSSLRFSLGRFTTIDDIDQAIQIVKKAIIDLRMVASP